MDIKDFYEFGSKLTSSTIQAHPFNLSKREEGVEDAGRKLIKGDYHGIEMPVIFKQMYGKNFCDILDTGSVSLYLISDKMKNLLIEEKISGWQVYPIKLLTKKGIEISGYHGFSITGRCGTIDYKQSEIIEKRSVENGPLSKYYKGLHIGLDKWDGNDFFLTEGTLYIIVTAKVAKIIKKNKLINVRMHNLADIETWEASIPKRLRPKC
jgi:hypothetical protein